MLKKHIKWVVLIFASLCLFLAMGFFVQKFWMHPKNVQKASTDNPVEFDEAEGVSMTVPGSTQNTYWELHIDKIKTTAGDVDKLDRVEGVYYVNKAPTYQMSGKQGAIYLKTRKLEITGDVVLKAMDGSKKLTADRLIWDTLGNKVTAQENAILETPQATVTTEEVVANLGMDHADFNGQTKVSYQGTNQ
jgi:LPS export ABC transporter protein LptC